MRVMASAKCRGVRQKDITVQKSGRFFGGRPLFVCLHRFIKMFIIFMTALSVFGTAKLLLYMKAR